MGLALARALRLADDSRGADLGARSAAFVGAGGKTTAIFQLARELKPPVVITTTTHLGAWQVPLADEHIIAFRAEDLPRKPEAKVYVITGPLAGATADGLERFGPSSSEVLQWLHDTNPWNLALLLVEADGAHRKPLKAPVASEPAIPPYMGLTVVLEGLTGLGKPLSEATAHRADKFSALSGLAPGATITPEALVRVLVHPQGGLKGIPPGARRVALLNQADTEDLQAQARSMVPGLLGPFDAVIVASLGSKTVHAVHEPVAGIVLAAGGSTRLGRPKALLDWHGEPFVRRVAETALAAGLRPAVVVTGSHADEVQHAIEGLPVQVVRNATWESGQASSIRTGLQALPTATGAAVFLLADQPQVGVDVITALVNQHAATLSPIIAPLIMMEKRANPVLFDRAAFPDLVDLQGDVGGRAVFSRHHVDYLPWYDERLLLDVDTEEDYRRLLEDDRA